MKRFGCYCLLVAALPACAIARPSARYVGRPVAEAVARLGPPVAVADYAGKGRYFTFSLSDFRLAEEDAENPRNWTDPTTRLTRQRTAADRARYPTLPPWILSPAFRPSACTITLVADWSEARHSWVAKRTIRTEAPPSGRCTARVLKQ